MGLLRTVSEINGDFALTSQIVPRFAFYAHAEGVPLEFCNDVDGDAPNRR